MTSGKFNKNWIRIITYIVIISFLSQNLAWAKGPGALTPNNKQFFEKLEESFKNVQDPCYAWKQYKSIEPHFIEILEQSNEEGKERLKDFVEENKDNLPGCALLLFSKMLGGIPLIDNEKRMKSIEERLIVENYPDKLIEEYKNTVRDWERALRKSDIKDKRKNFKILVNAYNDSQSLYRLLESIYEELLTFEYGKGVEIYILEHSDDEKECDCNREYVEEWNKKLNETGRDDWSFRYISLEEQYELIREINHTAGINVETEFLNCPYIAERPEDISGRGFTSGINMSLLWAQSKLDTEDKDSLIMFFDQDVELGALLGGNKGIRKRKIAHSFHHISNAFDNTQVNILACRLNGDPANFLTGLEKEGAFYLFKHFLEDAIEADDINSAYAFSEYLLKTEEDPEYISYKDMMQRMLGELENIKKGKYAAYKELHIWEMRIGKYIKKDPVPFGTGFIIRPEICKLVPLFEVPMGADVYYQLFLKYFNNDIWLMNLPVIHNKTAEKGRSMADDILKYFTASLRVHATKRWVMRRSVFGSDKTLYPANEQVINEDLRTIREPVRMKAECLQGMLAEPVKQAQAIIELLEDPRLNRYGVNLVPVEEFFSEFIKIAGEIQNKMPIEHSVESIEHTKQEMREWPQKIKLWQEVMQEIVKNSLNRTRITPDSGRWGFLGPLYNRIKPNWLGEIIAPSFIESGLFVGGGSLLLIWIFGLSLTFNLPVLGIVVGIQFLWHLLHNREAFAVNKLAITDLTLLLLVGIYLFKPTGFIFIILLISALIIPHLIVNRLLPELQMKRRRNIKIEISPSVTMEETRKPYPVIEGDDDLDALESVVDIEGQLDAAMRFTLKLVNKGIVQLDSIVINKFYSYVRQLHEKGIRLSNRHPAFPVYVFHAPGVNLKVRESNELLAEIDDIVILPRSTVNKSIEDQNEKGVFSRMDGLTDKEKELLKNIVTGGRIIAKNGEDTIYFYKNDNTIYRLALKEGVIQWIQKMDISDKYTMELIKKGVISGDNPQNEKKLREYMELWTMAGRSKQFTPVRIFMIEKPRARTVVRSKLRVFGEISNVIVLPEGMVSKDKSKGRGMNYIKVQENWEGTSEEEIIELIRECLTSKDTCIEGNNWIYKKDSWFYVAYVITGYVYRFSKVNPIKLNLWDMNICASIADSFKIYAILNKEEKPVIPKELSRDEIIIEGLLKGIYNDGKRANRRVFYDKESGLVHIWDELIDMHHCVVLNTRGEVVEYHHKRKWRFYYKHKELRQNYVDLADFVLKKDDKEDGCIGRTDEERINSVLIGRNTILIPQREFEGFHQILARKGVSTIVDLDSYRATIYDKNGCIIINNGNRNVLSDEAVRRHGSEIEAFRHYRPDKVHGTETELYEFDHHFPDKCLKAHTATSLVVNYLRNLSEEERKEVLPKLQQAMFIQSHIDTDNCIAKWIIKNWNELAEEDINFLAAMVFYSDHFMLPKEYEGDEKISIKIRFLNQILWCCMLREYAEEVSFDYIFASFNYIFRLILQDPLTDIDSLLNKLPNKISRIYKLHKQKLDKELAVIDELYSKGELIVDEYGIAMIVSDEEIDNLVFVEYIREKFGERVKIALNIHRDPFKQGSDICRARIRILGVEENLDLYSVYEILNEKEREPEWRDIWGGRWNAGACYYSGFSRLQPEQIRRVIRDIRENMDGCNTKLSMAICESGDKDSGNMGGGMNDADLKIYAQAETTTANILAQYIIMTGLYYQAEVITKALSDYPDRLDEFIRLLTAGLIERTIDEEFESGRTQEEEAHAAINRICKGLEISNDNKLRNEAARLYFTYRFYEILKNIRKIIDEKTAGIIDKKEAWRIRKQVLMDVNAQHLIKNNRALYARLCKYYKNYRTFFEMNITKIREILGFKVDYNSDICGRRPTVSIIAWLKGESEESPRGFYFHVGKSNTYTLCHNKQICINLVGIKEGYYWMSFEEGQDGKNKYAVIWENEESAKEKGAEPIKRFQIVKQGNILAHKLNGRNTNVKPVCLKEQSGSSRIRRFLLEDGDIPPGYEVVFRRPSKKDRSAKIPLCSFIDITIFIYSYLYDLSDQKLWLTFEKDDQGNKYVVIWKNEGDSLQNPYGYLRKYYLQKDGEILNQSTIDEHKKWVNTGRSPLIYTWKDHLKVIIEGREIRPNQISSKEAVEFLASKLLHPDPNIAGNAKSALKDWIDTKEGAIKLLSFMDYNDYTNEGIAKNSAIMDILESFKINWPFVEEVMELFKNYPDDRIQYRALKLKSRLEKEREPTDEQLEELIRSHSNINWDPLHDSRVIKGISRRLARRNIPVDNKRLLKLYYKIRFMDYLRKIVDQFGNIQEKKRKKEICRKLRYNAVLEQAPAVITGISKHWNGYVAFLNKCREEIAKISGFNIDYKEDILSLENTSKKQNVIDWIKGETKSIPEGFYCKFREKRGFVIIATRKVILKLNTTLSSLLPGKQYWISFEEENGNKIAVVWKNEEDCKAGNNYIQKFYIIKNGVILTQMWDGKPTKRVPEPFKKQRADQIIECIFNNGPLPGAHETGINKNGTITLISHKRLKIQFHGLKKYYGRVWISYQKAGNNIYALIWESKDIWENSGGTGGYMKRYYLVKDRVILAQKINGKRTGRRPLNAPSAKEDGECLLEWAKEDMAEGKWRWKITADRAGMETEELIRAVILHAGDLCKQDVEKMSKMLRLGEPLLLACLSDTQTAEDKEAARTLRLFEKGMIEEKVEDIAKRTVVLNRKDILRMLRKDLSQILSGNLLSGDLERKILRLDKMLQTHRINQGEPQTPKAVIPYFKEHFAYKYFAGMSEAEQYENLIAPLVEEYGFGIGLNISKRLGLVRKEEAETILRNIKRYKDAGLFQKIGFRTILVFFNLVLFCTTFFLVVPIWVIISAIILITILFAIPFVLEHNTMKSKIGAFCISFIQYIYFIGMILFPAWYIFPLITVVPFLVHSFWNIIAGMFIDADFKAVVNQNTKTSKYPKEQPVNPEIDQEILKDIDIAVRKGPKDTEYEEVASIVNKLTAHRVTNKELKIEQFIDFMFQFAKNTDEPVSGLFKKLINCLENKWLAAKSKYYLAVIYFEGEDYHSAKNMLIQALADFESLSMEVNEKMQKELICYACYSLGMSCHEEAKQIEDEEQKKNTLREGLKYFQRCIDNIDSEFKGIDLLYVYMALICSELSEYREIILSLNNAGKNRDIIEKSGFGVNKIIRATLKLILDAAIEKREGRLERFFEEIIEHGGTELLESIRSISDVVFWNDSRRKSLINAVFEVLRGNNQRKKDIIKLLTHLNLTPASSDLITLLREELFNFNKRPGKSFFREGLELLRTCYTEEAISFLEELSSHIKKYTLLIKIGTIKNHLTRIVRGYGPADNEERIIYKDDWHEALKYLPPQNEMDLDEYLLEWETTKLLSMDKFRFIPADLIRDEIIKVRREERGNEHLEGSLLRINEEYREKFIEQEEVLKRKVKEADELMILHNWEAAYGTFLKAIYGDIDLMIGGYEWLLCNCREENRAERIRKKLKELWYKVEQCIAFMNDENEEKDKNYKEMIAIADIWRGHIDELKGRDSRDILEAAKVFYYLGDAENALKTMRLISAEKINDSENIEFLVWELKFLSMTGNAEEENDEYRRKLDMLKKYGSIIAKYHAGKILRITGYPEEALEYFMEVFSQGLENLEKDTWTLYFDTFAGILSINEALRNTTYNCELVRKFFGSKRGLLLAIEQAKELITRCANIMNIGGRHLEAADMLIKLEKLLQLSEKSFSEKQKAVLFLEKASSYHRMGRIDEALRTYIESLETSQNNEIKSRIWNNIIYIYYKNGDIPKVLESAKNAWEGGYQITVLEVIKEYIDKAVNSDKESIEALRRFIKAEEDSLKEAVSKSFEEYADKNAKKLVKALLNTFLYEDIDSILINAEFKIQFIEGHGIRVSLGERSVMLKDKVKHNGRPVEELPEGIREGEIIFLTYIINAYPHIIEVLDPGIIAEAVREYAESGGEKMQAVRNYVIDIAVRDTAKYFMETYPFLLELVSEEEIISVIKDNIKSGRIARLEDDMLLGLGVCEFSSGYGEGKLVDLKGIQESIIESVIKDPSVKGKSLQAVINKLNKFSKYKGIAEVYYRKTRGNEHVVVGIIDGVTKEDVRKKLNTDLFRKYLKNFCFMNPQSNFINTHQILVIVEAPDEELRRAAWSAILGENVIRAVGNSIFICRLSNNELRIVIPPGVTNADLDILIAQKQEESEGNELLNVFKEYIKINEEGQTVTIGSLEFQGQSKEEQNLIQTRIEKILSEIEEEEATKAKKIPPDFYDEQNGILNSV